ncbi:MAG: hypothetical protein DLM57_04575 [Pseudonocardiales bacterium]|nr:MAG: hypothetical protein DLM57_04575 [Pseudonocardiales bacterium]
MGRALIALVWAIGDAGQVAIARSGGLGDRPGDRPLMVFAASALIGAVLLCGLVVVNVRAVKAFPDPERSRLAHLQIHARVLAWLCGLRLVAVIGALVVARGSGTHDSITQSTFLELVVLTLFDAGVALAIAATTVTGLHRSAQVATSASQ